MLLISGDIPVVDLKLTDKYKGDFLFSYSSHV